MSMKAKTGQCCELCRGSKENYERGKGFKGKIRKGVKSFY